MNTNRSNTDEEILFKNRHTQHTDKDTASTEDDQSSTNSFQNGQRLTESPSIPPPPPPSSTTSNSQSVNILDPLASAMSISNITNVTLDVPTNNIHNTQPGPQQIAAAALREKDREIATMLEAVGKQSAYENKLKREIALHLRQNTNLNSMVEHLTKELQAKQALLTNINNDKDTLQQGASGHSQHNTHNQYYRTRSASASSNTSSDTTSDLAQHIDKQPQITYLSTTLATPHNLPTVPNYNPGMHLNKQLQIAEPIQANTLITHPQQHSQHQPQQPEKTTFRPTYSAHFSVQHTNHTPTATLTASTTTT